VNREEKGMPALETASPRILVGLATYNERDNLASLTHEILDNLPSGHVLVTDDASPDGTGKLADELARADARIRVVHRSGKLGLGSAILMGMRKAIEGDYDYFISMDADYSHHPRYLPALVEGMERHDVMIGSRYIPGGGTEGWPASRKLMSCGVNLLVRMLMRLPAKDCSGGFRCYRVAKLREAQPERLTSRGYSFQEEMLYRCRRVHCRIGETPIVFANRRAGTSKVNPHEVIRSLGTLVLLGSAAFLGLDHYS
jgi:dolichol-phosphate mannosyltransferase